MKIQTTKIFSIVFQFYLSSIKRNGVPFPLLNHLSFNSTLVQLKVRRQRTDNGKTKEFQFYLSSIKRGTIIFMSYNDAKFQFYLSSIKSGECFVMVFLVSVVSILP